MSNPLPSALTLLEDHPEQQYLLALLIERKIVSESLEEILALRWYELPEAVDFPITSWRSDMLRMQQILIKELAAQGIDASQLLREKTEDEGAKVKLRDFISVSRSVSSLLGRLVRAARFDRTVSGFMKLSDEDRETAHCDEKTWGMLRRLQNEVAIRFGRPGKLHKDKSQPSLLELLDSPAEKLFVKRLICDGWLNDSVSGLLSIGPEIQEVRWIGTFGWEEIQTLQQRFQKDEVVETPKTVEPAEAGLADSAAEPDSATHQPEVESQPMAVIEDQAVEEVEEPELFSHEGGGVVSEAAGNLLLADVLVIDQQHILDRLIEAGLFDGTVRSLMSLKEDQVMPVRSMGKTKWKRIQSWQHMILEKFQTRADGTIAELELDQPLRDSLFEAELKLHDGLLEAHLFDGTIGTFLKLTEARVKAAKKFGAKRWGLIVPIQARLLNRLSEQARLSFYATKSTTGLAPEDDDRPISTLYDWGPTKRKWFKIRKKIGSILDEGIIRDRVGDFILMDPLAAKGAKAIGRVSISEGFPKAQAHIRNALLPGNEPGDLAELEAFLIRDLKAFLSESDPRNRGFLMQRWGIGSPRLTLVEIGIQCSLTRERVRQVQEKEERRFSYFLSVHPERLWPLIEDQFLEELSLAMPTLRKLFSDETAFVRFLEFSTQGIIPRLSSLDVLAAWEAMDSEPTRNNLLKKLMEIFELSDRQARLLLRHAVETKKLVGHGVVLIPSRLNLDSKIAVLLRRYPRGLAKNELGHLFQAIFGMEGSEPQIRGSLSRDNPDISIFGNFMQSTIYGHSCFKQIEEEKVSNIFNAIRSHLEQSGFESVRVESILRGLPYDENPALIYDLLRKQGDQFGIRWMGKSKVNTVSLIDDRKTVNLNEYVYRIVAEYKNGLSISECTRRMHHRSHNYVSMILGRLASEGRFLRLDGGVYVTEENFLESHGQHLRTITSRIDEALSEAPQNFIHIPYLRKALHREEIELTSHQLKSACTLIQKQNGTIFVNGMVLGVEDPPHGSLSEFFRNEVRFERSLHPMEQVASMLLCSRRSLSIAYYNTKPKRLTND